MHFLGTNQELTLKNVFYVSEIRKNLVSGSLLKNHRFHMISEILRVECMSGKGMSVGMWKVNVMITIKSNMYKVSSSTYMLESSKLWNGRLGHINYDTLRRLINLDHIPTFQIYSKHKCETYVETKLTRSSFPSIERNIEPLNLIHNHICDLKFVQTRGAYKYFITFIDDSTKYCYVYLLKIKNEVI